VDREFRLPYGKGYMTVRIPCQQLAGVLESQAHSFKPPRGQAEAVDFALDNPVGSDRIEDLAEGKRRIVVITSDHTRPVPSRITLPLLLDRLKAKNPQADVTILIATGFHRPATREEMLFKFGQNIVDGERIVNHDCRDRGALVSLGALPSGAELWLNRLAVEADLLVAEGFIEPHFFAGYSGGCKSVLPGVAGERTVLANHCSKFIASEYCRTGIIEGNPMRVDMVEAARRCGLAFILNVVVNAQKEVINAFAGDPVLAHQEGCRFVEELASVPAAPADIVVTTNGGYPLDQNVYQAVKGMTAAEARPALSS